MPVAHAPERPAPVDQTEPAATRPLAVSTCLLAIAVAAAGLVLATGLAVLSSFLGGADGSSASAVRAGAVLWLGAHGASLSVASVTLSLVPLLAPLLIGLVLLRGCRWAVASSAPGSGVLPVGLRVSFAAVVGAACYCAVLVLVGWWASQTAVPGELGTDVLRGAALSAAAVTLTLAVGLGLADGAWRELTAHRVGLRAVVRGAAAGVVAMLAAAAVVLVVVLALAAERMLAIGAELTPGTSGRVGLVALCVATLPNAVLWTVAYLFGPGFAIGPATVVSPDVVVLGPLPALPLFGALPAPGPAPPWATVLTVVPILVGVLAGVVTGRRLGGASWWLRMCAGAATGLLAGLVLVLLMLAAGGGVGPERMQQTGPVPAALFVSALTLTVAASAGTVAHGALGGWLPGWLRRAH